MILAGTGRPASVIIYNKNMTPDVILNKTEQLRQLGLSDKQLEYALWHATPPSEREPADKTKYSEDNEIGRSTLWNWEQLDMFWDAVKEYRVLVGKTKTAKVLDALYQRIIKDGNAREIELWLRYFDDYKETSSLEIKDKRKSTKKLDMIMSKLMVKKDDNKQEDTA